VLTDSSKLKPETPPKNKEGVGYCFVPTSQLIPLQAAMLAYWAFSSNPGMDNQSWRLFQTKGRKAFALAHSKFK